MRMKSIYFFLSFFLGASGVSANQALEFDGSSDSYVTLPNTLGLSTIKTIEAWINPDACGATPKVIYATSANIFFCENNKIRFQQTTCGYKTAATSAQNISVNEWTHVALVFESTTGTDSCGNSGATEANQKLTRLYVNGVLNGERYLPSVSASSNVRLGSQSGITSRTYDGEMDEVRLWNVARTAEEIIAFKDISLADYSVTGLQAVYNMEDISGTVLTNATGVTARNATLVGMGAANQTVADDYWGLDWREFESIKAGDQTSSSQFGHVVAMDGDTVVVGAPFKATQGAVYVYIRDGEEFTQQAKLVSPNPGASFYFGHSVDIAGDRIVVGEYKADIEGNDQAGAAYVFERSGTTWNSGTRLQPSVGSSVDDWFGYAVAIDNPISGIPTVAVTALGRFGTSAGEKIYVFNYADPCGSGCPVSWHQKKVFSNQAEAGDDVDIEENTLVVGARSCDTAKGCVYVYRYSGSSWSYNTKLSASDGDLNDYFGRSISLSGDRLAVGAHWHESTGSGNTGAVYLFNRSSSDIWTEDQIITSSDNENNSGASVALAGDRLAILQSNSWSSIVIYTNHLGTFSQEDIFAPSLNPNTLNPFSLAISGETIVSGRTQASSNYGRAFFFEPTKAPTHVEYSDRTSNLTEVAEDDPGATVATLVPTDYSRNDTLTMNVTADDSAADIFEVVGTTLKN